MSKIVFTLLVLLPLMFNSSRILQMATSQTVVMDKAQPTAMPMAMPMAMPTVITT